MSTLSVPVLQLNVVQQVLGQQSEKCHATLPVSNPTRSFWIDSTPDANPLAKEGTEGDLINDIDVCIIGSGITGVSAAYHLAKQSDELNNSGRPLKVVILEARDFCSGATGRNGGHLSPSVFRDFASREVAYGSAEAKRIYDIENYTTSEIINIIRSKKLDDAVDLVAGGRVVVFVTEKEAASANTDYSAAKSAGVDLRDVEWIDVEAMQKVYGIPFPAFRYQGYTLWPLKFVTELYKLALNHNPSGFSLNLHTNTPVTAITPSSDQSRRWIIHTPRGHIKCSYVIHATNAYASYLLPHMHGPEGIIPTRGQVISLRANAPSSQLTRSGWRANEGFEYWFPRPLKSGEEYPLIILGGGREATRPDFEYYITGDSVVRPDVGKVLRDFLPGMFPGKYQQGREPEMEWAGIMGFTKLEDPFVGPVVGKSKLRSDEFKGQFISAGYTGHGMTRAYACAEVVAEMIAAEIRGETWIQPDWFPRHFLTTVRDYSCNTRFV